MNCPERDAASHEDIARGAFYHHQVLTQCNIAQTVMPELVARYYKFRTISESGFKVTDMELRGVLLSPAT